VKMNPNNLFAGYSYREKIRFMAVREQVRKEEQIKRIGELDERITR